MSAEQKAENPEMSSPSACPEPLSKVLFDPGWRFYAIFSTLCIITIAAALDATSLSVALPVSPIPNPVQQIAYTPAFFQLLTASRLLRKNSTVQQSKRSGLERPSC